MQKTSELYKKLIDTRGHVKEAELIVAGEEYGSGRIVSMETDGGLFEQETVSVGGCVSRQLDVVLYGAGDIPKGAKLIPRYRVRSGGQVSEWVQKGTFYIDTREPDKETGTVSIHAFDDFLRMETEWTPAQDLEFPMPMDQAAKAVAQHYGVEIDPRSRLRSDYYIDYPAGGTTGRQVLQWIAAAHGGNWTMTDAGLARLIRLRDLDSESGLLVNQRGRVIVIGGRAIRVDKKVSGESYDGPSDKVFVGANAASVIDPPALEPVTKIVILVDDDAYFEAGDDSGQMLELTCPYGTQKMADDLLKELKGYRHKPVSAVDALIDPAAELGDGVTVNGVYTVLAQMVTTFDLLMASDIGAPGQREIESEIGRYVGSATKSFDRKIAQTRSQIKKASDKINLRVEELGQSTAEDLEKYAESVTKSLGELQKQIDGAIETWFFDYEPTNDNYPASEWTDEAAKQKHLKDLFYVVENEELGGRAYRWVLVGDTYKWQLVEDVDITKALAAAARAQDTADHKRRNFTEQPYPPYDVGDLWTQGPNGDLMRCNTARASGSFVEGDWGLASKYTDDSALTTFLNGDYKKDLEDLRSQSDQKAETWYQSGDPSTAWTSTALKNEHVGDMWYCTNSSDVTHYQKSWRWSGSTWEEMKTSPPQAVFDQIDGKAQIFIAEPKTPYRKGDLWFNSETSDIMTCISDRLSGSYSSGDWKKRNKYTDDSALNTFLTGQYKTDLDGIRTQADQKAETWYQADNPADAWTTDALKAEHEGDMWYCTGSGDTTHYQKFWRWSGSKWQEMTSTPPEAVFDKIDGKAQIYINQPTPPYHEGDLWFNSDTSDIMTCVKDRLSGNYDVGDWEKRNKYTDDSYAKDKYSELDLKIGSITLEVANGETKSSLTLKVGETVLASADIVLSGVVTFEGLRNGTTVIDGGWINTKNLNLTGKITWGDLSDAAKSNIVSSSNFRTYLDDELVRSPTIQGATIQGGILANLNKYGKYDAWLEIYGTTNLGGGLRLWSTGNEYTPLFEVDAGDFDSVALKLKGTTFIQKSGGTKFEPKGTWDFSSATVTGLNLSGADHVTEQSTYGIWTYRKWASGIVECWARREVGGITVTNGWGNIFSTAASTFSSVAYPVTFASPPSVQVTPENTGSADWWPATFAAGTSGQSPSYQICRGSKKEDVANYTLNYYVIGKILV